MSNSVVTVEVWLSKDAVANAPLSEVHDLAVREALKLLERAIDSAPTAKVITGF